MSSTTLTALGTYIVSLVVIVGLVVLIALHDVTEATAIPIIAVIAGVHVGNNLTTTTKTQ